MKFAAWMRIGIPVVVALAVVSIALVVVGQAGAARECNPEMDWFNPYVCNYGRMLRQVPTPTPVPTRVPVTVNSPDAGGSLNIVPFTYAYVVTGPVPLYADVDAIAAGSAGKSLALGYVWVRITGSDTVNDQEYYRIKDGSYVPASFVTFVRPSSFEGVVNPAHLPFAWVLVYTQLSPLAGEQPAPDAPSVSRYQVVNIYEEQPIGDEVWYRVGDNQWIEQKRLGVARPGPRPEEIPAGEKWIEINLFEQTLMAYEGDRMVYATLISSGLPQWPTVTGVFRAWAKVHHGDMYGAEGRSDYYYLEDVPWSLFFHDDFAIHGAYWHDRFGYPHSHGCVNLSPPSARWLFEWSDPPLPEGQVALYTKDDNPGMWVWVHD